MHKITFFHGAAVKWLTIETPSLCIVVAHPCDETYHLSWILLLPQKIRSLCHHPSVLFVVVVLVLCRAPSVIRLLAHIFDVGVLPISLLRRFVLVCCTELMWNHARILTVSQHKFFSSALSWTWNVSRSVCLSVRTQSVPRRSSVCAAVSHRTSHIQPQTRASGRREATSGVHSNTQVHTNSEESWPLARQSSFVARTCS